MMRPKNLTLIFACLPGIAIGQWWNPFEPKDYNECIIKNMKHGMSEEAITTLKQACIRKYPTPEFKERIKKEDRYRKCGIKMYDYSKYQLLSIDGKGSNKTRVLLENLKYVKYWSEVNTLSFNNMNQFGVSALLIGFTKSSQCYPDSSDYSYTTFCTMQGKTENGIPKGTFGYLQCEATPIAAKSMGYCVLGFSPIYNRFDDSLLHFMEKNGYCK
jgi:hypothetical protein